MYNLWNYKVIIYIEVIEYIMAQVLLICFNFFKNCNLNILT